MPQMAPLNWNILSLYFIFIIMGFFFSSSHIIFFSSAFSQKNFYSSNKIWLW